MLLNLLKRHRAPLAPPEPEPRTLTPAEEIAARHGDIYGAQATLLPIDAPLTIIDGGMHLAGQPLNSQLTSAGAFLIEACHTSSDYRLYALSGGAIPKPGLVFSAKGGRPIEVEIWAVPEGTFGRFVANVPPPLAIGSCLLESGRAVKSFVCEPCALTDATEITHFGGWRAYRRGKNGKH